MDCDLFGYGFWFRLLLNVTSGAMFGWAYGKVRSARRLHREMQEWRAMTEANLQRSERLLGKMQAFPGDDDDPADPSPLH
jgi:hypothetical protein